MRTIALLLILTTGLCAQLRDSSNVNVPSSVPIVRYKQQYLLFPAIGCGFGSFMLFKKVRDLRDDASKLRTSYFSNPTSAEKLEEEADQKTLYATGLALGAAVLVWFAFQPTYEFPEGKITVTPTGNSVIVSYRF